MNVPTISMNTSRGVIPQIGGRKDSINQYVVKTNNLGNSFRGESSKSIYKKIG